MSKDTDQELPSLGRPTCSVTRDYHDSFFCDPKDQQPEDYRFEFIPLKCSDPKSVIYTKVKVLDNIKWDYNKETRSIMLRGEDYEGCRFENCRIKKKTKRFIILEYSDGFDKWTFKLFQKNKILSLYI